jgi:23S rRNA (cytidine1920-2'-O)/16S rRNA (cytidine1409-2'-O)-methyltransferase
LVTVAGAHADKPSRLVGADEPVRVIEGPPRFVGRGGEKLDAALSAFSIDVADRWALDAGASTGGFTDCLLRRGAAHVVAVDVGYGQLHPRLREDGRVTVLERTNVRHLTIEAAGGRLFDVVTVDLSFISLRTVAVNLIVLAGPAADVVLLVKPQFEAGRVEASRGRGVIRDAEVWNRVLREVCDAFAAHDAVMIGVMVSPLRGAEGNVEFLAHLRAHTGQQPVVDFEAVVAEASRLRGR